MSRGTVTNRIAKLEAQGDRRLHGAPAADVKQDQINAWMSIAVEGNQTRVIAELLGEPSIAVLHDTNGRWDLLAQLRGNFAEMSQALERIRLIYGISNTETSIHLVIHRVVAAGATRGGGSGRAPVRRRRQASSCSIRCGYSTTPSDKSGRSGNLPG